MFKIQKNKEKKLTACQLKSEERRESLTCQQADRTDFILFLSAEMIALDFKSCGLT